MKRFGLIGKTLKHSFSKTYFEKKFVAEGLGNCHYDNFEIDSIQQLPKIISETPGLRGLNVTIPYKEEVLDFLDHKTETVEKIGACNCIKIVDEELHGFNTDAVAFKNSLHKNLKPHHKCALILGSGGASKAVQFALKELGIDFFIVSRRQQENQLGYEDVGEKVIQEHQMIINATPLGMFPNIDQYPSIPYEALTPDHLLYDLIYNPPKTKFLEQGEKRGATVMNGYEMLVAQAEESWRIWNSNE